ncbi:hypothetical protein Q7P37_009435 [Cladosporium fusiforme]
MSSINPTNEKGQGASHAVDSQVPGKVQEKVQTPQIPLHSTHSHTTTEQQVPKNVEDKLPDAAHDTGSNKHTGKVSHATGDSKVPKTLQEGLPEKVEKIVPNAIHDTKGAQFSDGSVDRK